MTNAAYELSSAIIGHLRNGEGLGKTHVTRAIAKEMVRYLNDHPDIRSLNMSGPYTNTPTGLLDPYVVEELSALEHVNTIDLSRRRISPHELQKLAHIPSLTTLKAHNCGIDDNAAKSVAKLTNLKALSLYGNTLTDEGAKTIAALSNLEQLNVSYNHIGNDGATALSKLSRLNDLNIGGNKEMDGDALDAICRLPALTDLALYNISIGYEGLEKICSRLPNLIELDLAHTGLSHIAPIKRLAKLQSLNIGDNDIGDEGTEYISTLEELTELDVCNTGISEEGAKALSRLSQLKKLAIQTNPIGDKGMEYITSSLHKLEVLLFGTNGLTHEGVEAISSLTNLRSLYRDQADESEITARELGMWATLPHLEEGYFHAKTSQRDNADAVEKFNTNIEENTGRDRGDYGKHTGRMKCKSRLDKVWDYAEEHWPKRPNDGSMTEQEHTRALQAVESARSALLSAVFSASQNDKDALLNKNAKRYTQGLIDAYSQFPPYKNAPNEATQQDFTVITNAISSIMKIELRPSR